MGRAKVLLTGATGSVGGELLVRLLAEEARPIVCLVRADSDAAARERGRRTLASLTGSGDLAGMIEWVAGDVTRPRLGLDRRTASRLASEVEEVFHCAASTALDLSLSEAHRANVQSAATVHRLCEEAVARGGFRRLHHVSTAFAAGRSAGPLHADQLPDDRAELFRNTWERTKARAERFLRARWDRVPTTIYRPSFVAGESESGRTGSWSGLYQPLRMIAEGRLPFLPRAGLGRLDCVPVDFVAAGVLAIGRRRDTAGRAFHLVAGRDAITVERAAAETFAALSRRTSAPPRTRVLGPLAWRLLRGALSWASPEARRAIEAFSTFEPYTAIGAPFEDHRERGLLHAAGVVLAPASEFFPRAVEYALRANFGRPRRAASRRRVLDLAEPITAVLTPAQLRAATA